MRTSDINVDDIQVRKEIEEDKKASRDNLVPKPPASDLLGPALASGFASAIVKAFNERNSAEISANSTSQSPLPSKTFCDGIATAYDEWFKKAKAGQLTAYPVGIEALKSGLRSFDFTTWGNAFLAYWQFTFWLPSGLYASGVLTNAPVVAAELQIEINNLIFNEHPKKMSGSSDAFAERIADILHTYTTKLTVLAALNTAPPSTTLETVR